MTREILATKNIQKEELGELINRLERESESITVIEYTGTDAEKIKRYRFEEILEEGGVFYGQIDIEFYEDEFRAIGDKPLINDYFAKPVIQPPELQ